MHLTSEQIKNNITKLMAYMKKESIDFFYMTGNNEFLCEYTPLEESHRYYVTGFTGSTAHTLVKQSGEVFIYLDGRYHEQADKEIDKALVNIVKLDLTQNAFDAMKQTMQREVKVTIGIESDRTALSVKKIFESYAKVKTIHSEKLASLLSYKKFHQTKEIFPISLEITGETTASKLDRLIGVDEAYFLTSLDVIAWFSNCRGYHLPNQSSFLARGLAFKEMLYLLLPEGTKLKSEMGSLEKVSIEFYAAGKLLDVVRKIKERHQPRTITYKPSAINADDFEMLFELFHGDHLRELEEGLYFANTIKNAAEIKEMEQAIARADKAMERTLIWLKEGFTNKEKRLELDFKNKIIENYMNEGATSLSFEPIAAFAENSSIIHFKDSSKSKEIKENELAMLDSGAYFEGGYATDATRTILFGDKPTAKQKEIYQLVYKGLMDASNAVFPLGTSGIFIDSLARAPLYAAGYDFNHGTGHGVGINVHESGISVSKTRGYSLQIGQVTSIEPGIYIPGFGGVRLENLVVVEAHPTLKGMCQFRTLTKIPFDEVLLEGYL